jgi:hypothetical protein
MHLPRAFRFRAQLCIAKLILRYLRRCPIFLIPDFAHLEILFPFSLMQNGELTDFWPWQWARVARLTGRKVRSDDWFAPRSGAGQSGGLTQAGNSPFAPRSGANDKADAPGQTLLQKTTEAIPGRRRAACYLYSLSNGFSGLFLQYLQSGALHVCSTHILQLGQK